MDECPSVGMPVITTPVVKRKELLQRSPNVSGVKTRRKKVMQAVQTEKDSGADVACQTDQSWF